MDPEVLPGIPLSPQLQTLSRCPSLVCPNAVPTSSPPAPTLCSGHTVPRYRPYHSGHLADSYIPYKAPDPKPIPLDNLPLNPIPPAQPSPHRSTYVQLWLPPASVGRMKKTATSSQSNSCSHNPHPTVLQATLMSPDMSTAVLLTTGKQENKPGCLCRPHRTLCAAPERTQSSEI